MVVFLLINKHLLFDLAFRSLDINIVPTRVNFLAIDCLEASNVQIFGMGLINSL